MKKMMKNISAKFSKLLTIKLSLLAVAFLSLVSVNNAHANADSDIYFSISPRPSENISRNLETNDFILVATVNVKNNSEDAITVQNFGITIKTRNGGKPSDLTELVLAQGGVSFVKYVPSKSNENSTETCFFQDEIARLLASHKDDIVLQDFKTYSLKHPPKAASHATFCLIFL